MDALFPYTEALVGIAQVSIVFAGFAEISVVLSRRLREQWTYGVGLHTYAWTGLALAAWRCQTSRKQIQNRIAACVISTSSFFQLAR